MVTQAPVSSFTSSARWPAIRDTIRSDIFPVVRDPTGIRGHDTRLAVGRERHAANNRCSRSVPAEHSFELAAHGSMRT